MCKVLVVIFVGIHIVLSEEVICSKDYVCQGREGDSIVVPCGPIVNQSLQRGLTTFTYYNESSQLVLLWNSTEYLRLNLTMYEDKSYIICAVMNDGASNIHFSYSVSVLYSPRAIVEYRKNLNANINQPFFLQCPLISNPPPKCSWSIYTCFSSNISRNISEYEISYTYPLEDRCSLYFSKVFKLFETLCFSCSATNELGSDNYVFKALEFGRCSSETTIAISPQADEGSTAFHVSEGENITLRCDGFGFGELKPVIWEINTTSGNFTSITDTTFDYNQKLCLKTSYLRKANVTEDAAGMYTCIFDTGFQKVEIVVIRKIYKELGDGNIHEKEKHITWIVCAGLIAIFIISIASAFMTILIRRWRTNSDEFQFAKLEGHYDEIQYDFDAFISFAEKDKNVAEEAIKRPLEALGYNICWHHDAFVPGLAVKENMESFIFQSKYMIALISQSFFESAFCINELDIARRKIQGTCDNCLIPIMLDKWEGIPTELLKTTYINIDDKLLLPRLKNILEVPVQLQSEDKSVDSASISSAGSYITSV